MIITGCKYLINKSYFMPREIISKTGASAELTVGPAKSSNDFKDRLVKLIPSEIITAYITLQGLISSRESNKQLFIIIVFACLLVLTPLYLKYISKVDKIGQIVFTAIAFIIWVMASGGFKIMFPHVALFQDDFMGSILLVIYTMVIPFVYRG